MRSYGNWGMGAQLGTDAKDTDPWSERRIKLITDALLDRGTLTSEDIAALVG